MITISKPAEIPDKLTNEGKKLTDKNCTDYEANPNNYKSGKDEFEITPTIYNHSSVKKKLKKAQHDKCCFCEKEQLDEYGAVEHYRPKHGYKSTRKEKKIKKPGYYWLGYDWSNLFFVCGPCNTKKGNLFPLINEKERATWHKLSIGDEKPLLLKPDGTDDPRKHIVFKNEFIQGLTDFGKETIEICKLDRDSLNVKRKKVINLIQDNILILYTKNSNDKRVVDKAKKFLRECRSKEAEFSAAAIDYLKQFNIEVA